MSSNALTPQDAPRLQDATAAEWARGRCEHRFRTEVRAVGIPDPVAAYCADCGRRLPAQRPQYP